MESQRLLQTMRTNEAVIVYYLLAGRGRKVGMRRQISPASQTKASTRAVSILRLRVPAVFVHRGIVIKDLVKTMS